MVRYDKAAQAQAEAAQKHAAAQAAGDTEGATRLATELAAQDATLSWLQAALVAMGDGASVPNPNDALVAEGVLMNWTAAASEYATVWSQWQEAKSRGEKLPTAVLAQRLRGLEERKAALEQEVKRQMTAGTSLGTGGIKRAREARSGREEDERDGEEWGEAKATEGQA